MANGYDDIATRQRGQTTGQASQGVAYWGTYPEAYDTVVIAGYQLPGLSAVKGKGYEMRRGHHKVAGKHGVTTLFLANEPAQFTVTVMMTTEDHLRALEKLVSLFKPSVKPNANAPIGNPDSFTYAFTGQSSGSNNGSVLLGKKQVQDDSRPGYLSISHPMLALFRISHCRIVEVSIPVQREDKGMWEVELHCIEEVLEGSRKAKPGQTGDAGNIAGIATKYDSTIGRTPAPSTTNAGPPPK